MKNLLIKHFAISVIFFLYSTAEILSVCLAENWKAPYFQDHHLVGKIWDTHKNSWLTEKQLFTELLEYDYILLGEAHTNPDHHILQARIIDHISTNGEKPVVVMEMLASKQWQQQPRVWEELEKLKIETKAHNDKWPWGLYAPILQSIVQHQLELAAGNISRSDLHAWSQHRGTLTEDKLKKEFYINDEQILQLKKDIIDSHCGHANLGFVQFMVQSQLKRDEVLTTNLVSNTSPVVLIAGSGHIKNNYAVPMQLRKQFLKFSYLTISFKPVVPNLVNVENYIGENSSVFDILYFTPSQTNQDPCIRFRKQLEKLHKGGTN